MTQLLCSECGGSLAGKKGGTRTCSDKCRTARSVRLRASHQRAEHEADLSIPELETAAQREMRLAVRNHLDDRIHKILDKELEPIVRESITADVQRSIAALLALTPVAVAAIADDLTQEDSYDRRQKAYTLLMKYTAGHTKLVPDVDPAPPAVTVVFPGMERPEVVVEAELAEDEFECDACGEIQDNDQRTAPGADRCKSCHAGLQDRRAEIMKQLSQ